MYTYTWIMSSPCPSEPVKRGRNSAFGQYPKTIKTAHFTARLLPARIEHQAQRKFIQYSPSSTTEMSYSSRPTAQNGPKDNHNRAANTPLSQAKGQRGEQAEIVIAIMGTTGAGKSKFIRALTGDQSIIEGHSLQSCTRYPTVLVPRLIISRHAADRNLRDHLQPPTHRIRRYSRVQRHQPQRHGDPAGSSTMAQYHIFQ